MAWSHEMGTISKVNGFENLASRRSNCCGEVEKRDIGLLRRICRNASAPERGECNCKGNNWCREHLCENEERRTESEDWNEMSLAWVRSSAIYDQKGKMF
jgi:hypothetical protein